MLSSFRTFSLLLGLCAITSGCATAPHDAKASVPLVHPYLQNKTGTINTAETIVDSAILVPAVGSAAHNASSDSTVTIAGSQYAVSDEYLSALGNTCRKLFLQHGNNSHAHSYRAICKRDTAWALLPPLVSAVDEKDL